VKRCSLTHVGQRDDAESVITITELLQKKTLYFSIKFEIQDQFRSSFKDTIHQCSNLNCKVTWENFLLICKILRIDENQFRINQISPKLMKIDIDKWFEIKKSTKNRSNQLRNNDIKFDKKIYF